MNFINSIRENLKDPKKKSLTQLVLYLIFFIFVFVLLSSGNTTKRNYIDFFSLQGYIICIRERDWIEQKGNHTTTSVLTTSPLIVSNV